MESVTLNLAGLTFHEELARFESMLRASYPELSSRWSTVAVWERGSRNDEWQPGTEVDDLADYEDRFQQILSSVRSAWVNMTATTIHDGRLIVALEWLPDPTGERRVLPVSVNHNGFTWRELARLHGTGRSTISVTRKRRWPLSLVTRRDARSISSLDDC